MIHTWAVNIAEILSRELKLDKKRTSIVIYGLEVILGGIIKLFIFITLPLVLGVFTQFIAANLASGFLRLTSGGVHCSSYYRCLIVSTTIFLIIAFVSKYLFIYIVFVDLILWFSLALALVVFVIKAPVDVPEKPIRNHSRRRMLKIISCIMVMLYFLLFLYWKPEPDVILASSLGVLFHTFTLTRPGHTSVFLVDKSI